MMKLIEDLGMILPKPGVTTKYRMGIYECTQCGSHTMCNTVYVKRANKELCDNCANKTKVQPLKPLLQDDYKMKIIEDLGRVPNADGTKNNRRAIFECCNCGKHIKCLVGSAAVKVQTECLSCSNSHNYVKHGDSGSRLYKIHQEMHNRCYNPNKKFSEYYMGKGIKVCDEWFRNYDVFKEWAMSNGYSDELTIDREDGNKGYSPSNCRWVTKAVQTRNTKLLRVTNSTGYRGVSPKDWGYRTRITVDSIEKYLGMFETPLEAAKAYDRYVLENSLEHTLNNVLSSEELDDLARSIDIIKSTSKV